MDCPSTVSQEVCVKAKVEVEPEAKIGYVHACCVGRPHFEKCCRKSDDCTYMVSQMLCVRFPLTISATATAKPAGIVCHKPKVESCSQDGKPNTEEVSCIDEIRKDECKLIEAPTQNRGYKPIKEGGFCFPPLFLFPFFCQRFNR